jgi:DNA-binding response OmpR family regulator
VIILSLCILLANLSEDINLAVSSYLQSLGWRCICTTSGSQALLALQNQRFDVLVTDLILENTSSLPAIRYCRTHGTGVVVFTALDQDLIWQMCGPVMVLQKPAGFPEISAAIRKVCRKGAGQRG